MEALRQPRLLDWVRDHCRVEHYSLRTEQVCVHRIRGPRVGARCGIFEPRAARWMGAGEVDWGMSREPPVLRYLDGRLPRGGTFAPPAGEVKTPSETILRASRRPPRAGVSSGRL